MVASVSGTLTATTASLSSLVVSSTVSADPSAVLVASLSARIAAAAGLDCKAITGSFLSCVRGRPAIMAMTASRSGASPSLSDATRKRSGAWA